MNRLARQIHYQLYFPGRILIICLFFGIGSLAWNGSFFNLYLLMQAQKRLTLQAGELKAQSLDYDRKLNQAKGLQFITREAIDHYEMVGPDDLVFVFPEP